MISGETMHIVLISYHTLGNQITAVNHHFKVTNATRHCFKQIAYAYGLHYFTDNT